MYRRVLKWVCLSFALESLSNVFATQVTRQSAELLSKRETRFLEYRAFPIEVVKLLQGVRAMAL